VTRTSQPDAAIAAESQGTILVIDDDADMRQALEGLFRSVGLPVQTYASAQDFVTGELPVSPCCLILDVRMPGMSGLDLQTELANENVHLPIIFLTGYGDVPMAVRALKAGAVNFITKPVRDQDLLDAVMSALEQARRNWREEARRSGVKARLKSLTRREREIMTHVVAGQMNKQTAYELGISEVTVKIHRSNLMRKLGVRSPMELVRMADDLAQLPR
jgi:FixJ family two-component response regulator